MARCFDRFCAKIISPLAGQNPYQIKNTGKWFITFNLDDDDEMVSYDVTALFTSVPVDAALTVIKERLESDTTLNERNNLNPGHIIELLKFVLTAYCTLIQDAFYKQCHCASIKPFVCRFLYGVV